MERKEKTTAARFKRGRAEGMTTGTSSMAVADFMDIGSPKSGGASRRYGSAGSRCCNALSLLYSLRQHRRIVVTSQADLNHYDENVAQHLWRCGVRQSCPLDRPRQQRGMEWLWEAHRSPCESAVARYVPQALGPLSPSLERRSARQIGAIAQSVASY